MAQFVTLAFVVVLVPLALAPGLSYFDITPKLLVLMLGAGVLLLLMARKTVVDRRLALLLGTQAVLVVLATIFSGHIELCMAGSDWRRLGLPATLACLVIAAGVSQLAECRRRLLLACIAATGGVVALYTLLQYAGLDPLIDPKLYTIGEGEWAIRRPPGTLGHADYLGVYLLYTTFAAIGLALTSTRWLARALWAVAASAGAAAVLVTGSRGAWMGAVVGTMILLGSSRHRLRLLIAMLIFTVAAGAVFVSPAGEMFRARLRWFVEDPGGGARFLLWRDALNMAIAHPLVGYGPDSFERRFPAFESSELANHFPDRYYESPHNVVLDAMTTTGLAGALVFLLFAGSSLWNFARGAETERGLLAALAAALVAGLFLSETIPTHLYFLVFAALSFQGRKVEFPKSIAAPVGAVLLAFTLFYGSHLWRADRRMQQARESAERGDLAAFIRQGGEAANTFPWAGTYPMVFSRLLGNLAISPQIQEPSRAVLMALAADAAQKALATAANRQIAGVQLASVYAVQGRLADAEATLGSAVRAAPQWYRPHWLLAELHDQQGRREQAQAEARRALDLGARANPEAGPRCLAILR